MGLKSEPVMETRAASSNKNSPPTSVISRVGAEGSLPRSRFPMRSETGSAAPEAEIPRWEYPNRPRSWTVVRNPGFRTRINGMGYSALLKASNSFILIGTKRTRSPICRRVGGVLFRREQRKRGPADEAPSARGIHGIDAGLAPSDGDASRGNLQARGLQPRRGELLGQVAQVREPRGKAEEIDEVFRAGMETDDLFDGPSAMSGDVPEIGGHFPFIADGDFDRSRFGKEQRRPSAG